MLFGHLWVLYKHLTNLKPKLTDQKVKPVLTKMYWKIHHYFQVRCILINKMFVIFFFLIFNEFLLFIPFYSGILFNAILGCTLCLINLFFLWLVPNSELLWTESF